MKKLFTFLVVLFLSVPNIWAFTFQWAPIDPLFREALADPYACSTSFRSLGVLDEASVPDSVLVSNSETNQYEQIVYDDSSQRNYWQMKSAVNFGLLRFSIGPVQAEGYIQGGLNTVFQKAGSVDSLGFDGMYGAGATVRLFNIIAIQAGFHHFSGHWGDEILADLMEENPGLDLYSSSSIYHLEEYTRGNSWLAGVSLEPVTWGRMYFFAELPMERAWIRPGIHVPSSTLKPGSDDTSQFEYITGQEGLTGLTAYDSSYKAWRLQAGLEFRYPVLDIGSLFLAGDFQAHQDGQTLHQVGGYSPDNPWEFEITVGGGFEFNQTVLGRKMRLECYYHDGRFPLLNYFFQRSKYVIMGIAISG
ncbi:hypothetical protein [uncultured Sphaerochaeta sp.]|uniref:hypothetical protein n=1 Tax=uncultured Sphaerochaeta sp. TaxID=886478 RepID=UPI00374A25DF